MAKFIKTRTGVGEWVNLDVASSIFLKRHVHENENKTEESYEVGIRLGNDVYWLASDLTWFQADSLVSKLINK